MKHEENFVLVDGKINVSTEQTMDIEEFIKRIVNIDANKKNFISQIKQMEEQIEYNQKSIILQKLNIEKADKSLEHVYHFLHSNHREDIVLKIENMIKEAEERMAAQIQAQMEAQKLQE